MYLEQSFLLFGFAHLVVLANIAKPASSRQNIDCNQKAMAWDQVLIQTAKCTKVWQMVFKSNKQISSRNSQNIQIKGRTIDSKGQDGAKYAKLTIKSNFYGYVKIMGMTNGFYLCLSKTGLIVGRKKVANKKMKRCIFQRKYTSKGFIVYESTWRRGWYLGFRSDGTPKPASRVNPKSRVAQFMEVAQRGSIDHPQSRFGRRFLKRRHKQMKLKRPHLLKRLRS